MTRSFLSLLAGFLYLPAVFAPSSRASAGEIVCLTGKPGGGVRTKSARLDSAKLRVVLPGLDRDGYPAAQKGRRKGWRSFAQSPLCDGSLNTLIEWSDREFGTFGRDILVDLGKPYYLERVEVATKGKRLHNGRLYLKPEGGKSFVPVRYFDRGDYVDVQNNWRRRTAIIRFDKLGLVARHIRINVRGSHGPRFGELRILGRAARAGASRGIPPLLPYNVKALKTPAAIEQVPPPDPRKPVPSGKGPRFAFRAVRQVPPTKANKEYYQRLMRVFAALKYNRIIHEGLDWAVHFKSWPTRYGKAIGVAELKEAIRFNQSLGMKTTGGWAIAPSQWVLLAGDPSRVEARPGEAYLEKGRIKFKRYKGETLYKLSRVNACPLHPKNFETFKKVVDELCSIYTDEYFFGSVDEPLQWYNGSRWGCDSRCRGHDPVKLMVDWVNKCSGYIRHKHKRIHMYQTTILLKEHQGEAPGYPGGPKIPMYKVLERMPKERTALVNWSYGVWKRKKGKPDSSGLNRFLASKGYTRIIQNVGYTDASFAICEFTKWAGKNGADFIGASVANYGGLDLAGMARRFKFLDYVVTAEALWSPDVPKTGSREMASQIVNGVEKVREIMEQKKLPSRSAKAGDFFTVDLKAAANRSTGDAKPYDGKGWVDLGPGLDLQSLPRGKRTFCGIPFELLDPEARNGRSCVMLGPARRLGRQLPSEVKGIAVGRKAASLVFLHALTGAMEPRDKAPAFFYRVRFADGASVEFPVRYRIEIMEWLDQSAKGPNDFRIGWFLYGARPAWLGETASGKRAILYAAEWVNPRPDQTIRSVDMALPENSHAPGAALFAITGVSIKK